jgi:hypothetical protein
MLLVGGGLQLVLPSSTRLPDETELAPRRVHEAAELTVRDYPAMLANPIFAPDRKADATAVPVGGGMNGFAVLGIALAGDTATALVRGPGGMIQRLKPGDAMGGWTLVAAALDQLTFERNKERRVLTISKAPVGAAIGPAGAAGHGLPHPVGQMNKPANSDDSDDDSDSDDSDGDDDQ